ncbi:hypothetical protein EGT67_11780 [Prescottella agglutinans]|uniref:Uncharacterized protein n=1 Tax=Prescottella agglutinans TaxID=1644129 RepID=A0A438BEK6_9NOCA|nr:DUF6084 family protein [Prescottella agglutinans]RVW09456.1 hypothetical protein EGT67_11780 [Prescottella agglutinans]
MTALDFAVLSVGPEPFAVTPNLIARVRIAESTGATVHALALRCQIRIEPRRRRYSDTEEAGLLDLFGPRERWATTLSTFPWLHATATVPGFTGECVTELVLPCTYDFEVTASKYLHALEGDADGTVPLSFLFSGTVFTKGTKGFGVEQVPWDREAQFDLPVDVWRETVRQNFPSTGWLRLDHDTIAALMRYKAARGLPGIDQAVTELLEAAGEVAT